MIDSFSGNHPSGGCFGDSGGGTYVKDKKTGELLLLGISVSRGNSCSTTQRHTIPHNHREWIDNEVEKYRLSKSI